MKNSFKWGLVAVVVLAVLGTTVYFGNTQTQKGSFPNIRNVRPIALLPELAVVPNSLRDVNDTATVTLRNFGNGATRPFWYRLIVISKNSNNIPVYNYNNFYPFNLGAGEIVTLNLSDANIENIADIILNIDPTNRIRESNENNNQFVWSSNLPAGDPAPDRP